MEKNINAVELGKLGGKARADILPAKRRSEIAKMGADARIAKKKLQHKENDLSS